MHKASSLASVIWQYIVLLLRSETRCVLQTQSLRLQHRKNDEMLVAVFIVYKDLNFILGVFNILSLRFPRVLRTIYLNKWKHFTPSNLSKTEMHAEKNERKIREHQIKQNHYACSKIHQSSAIDVIKGTTGALFNKLSDLRWWITSRKFIKCTFYHVR